MDKKALSQEVHVPQVKSKMDKRTCVKIALAMVVSFITLRLNLRLTEQVTQVCPACVSNSAFRLMRTFSGIALGAYPMIMGWLLVDLLWKRQ